MTSLTFFNLLPVLLALFAAQPGAMQESVTRLVIQDEVILRVPLQPRPLGPQIDWLEGKGYKCIPVGAIRRAFLSGPQQVDFVLNGRARVRAHLDEDCPALDFYGSFYVQPQDERLCVRRDEIRSRMGGSCMIRKFKLLVPRLHQVP